MTSAPGLPGPSGRRIRYGEYVPKDTIDAYMLGMTASLSEAEILPDGSG